MIARLAPVVFALAFSQAAPPLGTRPVWPPPPLPARIQFVRSLVPNTVQGRPSVLSRLFRLIVGRDTDPTMTRPYGVAVGQDRRVYVADTFGRAIHVYDLQRSSYTSIKVDGESLIGVGLLAGSIFVTDSASGRVVCLDSRGRTVWTLGPTDGFVRPTGIATAVDRIYVVDTMANRVVMVDRTGAIMGSFGTRGPEPGQFNFPTNIALGPDGRVYVTDTMNFRIEVFDRDGRYLSSFGKLGDGSGDFDKPKGIAVDSEGHIYVVEGFNDVVQIFDQEGRLLLGFGESGSGDGQLWLPSGIAIVNDVIYVADSANQRVQVFEYLKESR